MQLDARHGNGGRRAGRLTFVWAVLLTLAPVLGCSDNPNTITLEVYTWWSHPVERAAFDAVLSQHRLRRENVEVVDLRSRDARTRRSQRMLAGAPPATFQANVGADLLRWALVDLQDDFDEEVSTPPDETQNLLTDLTDFYNDELLGNVPDDVDSMLRLGPGTPPFAVPINIHRLNVLYYNIDKVEKYEDPEGRRLLDIDTLCPETPGKAPLGATISLALTDHWTLLHLVFENLLAALIERERKRDPNFDPDFYKHLFEGHEPGERLPGGESVLVKKALECAKYLSLSSTNSFTWSEAAAAVGPGGDATFTVMGDWASAVLEPQLREGTVGRIAFPETEDLYVYTSDTFPLPRGVDYPEEALELLRTFASRGAQREFSRLKGSIPARFDTDFVSPPGWSTETEFRNLKKLLATSGYFQRYYPEVDLQDDLRDMLDDNATDAALDAALRRFTDAEKLLARWHKRREQGAASITTTTTEP